MRKLSLAAFLILLLNSAYLFSFGEPTLFYIFNVLLHVGLGIVLILPFCVYVYKHLGHRLQARIQKQSVSTLGQLGGIGITVGIISGVYLMIVGATTPYRWLLITHIASVSAGCLLFCIYLLRSAELLTPMLRKIIVGVLAIVVIFPMGAKLAQHYLPNECISLKIPHCLLQACTKRAVAQLAIFSLHPSKQKQGH